MRRWRSLKGWKARGFARFGRSHQAAAQRPARLFRCCCKDLENGEVGAAYSALQLRFLKAERAGIAALYAKGALDDEARRRIERELDLDDSRIRHAAASGTGRLVWVASRGHTRPI